MACNESDVTPTQPQIRWKMSEPCRAGECSECVANFSDGSVDYRCACDCHGWETDDESDCY
jgi:hypothetical protein